MTFDEITYLCQVICVSITLLLLAFAEIQWIVYTKKEHKAKMKLYEKELKEKQK